jgi:hypothetical protein
MIRGEARPPQTDSPDVVILTLDVFSDSNNDEISDIVVLDNQGKTFFIDSYPNCANHYTRSLPISGQRLPIRLQARTYTNDTLVDLGAFVHPVSRTVDRSLTSELPPRAESMAAQSAGREQHDRVQRWPKMLKKWIRISK